jgi:hypothetical protein
MSRSMAPGIIADGPFFTFRRKLWCTIAEDLMNHAKEKEQVIWPPDPKTWATDPRFKKLDPQP